MTDVEETEATARRSAGKPLGTPDRRSQSPKGAALRTCSSVRGNQWRGCGEEESGGQEHDGRIWAADAIFGWGSWIRRQWLESWTKRMI